MLAVQNDAFVLDGKDYSLELTSCVIDGEDQISYTTYGICLTDVTGLVLWECSDVSTSRTFVEDFIRLCIDGDASPLHIKDLLEDVLAGL